MIGLILASIYVALCVVSGTELIPAIHSVSSFLWVWYWIWTIVIYLIFLGVFIFGCLFAIKKDGVVGGTLIVGSILLAILVSISCACWIIGTYVLYYATIGGIIETNKLICAGMLFGLGIIFSLLTKNSYSNSK